MASAILRTVGNESRDGYSMVPVPDEVADSVPAVAASLASQRILGKAYDKEFHNAGLAYAAVRPQFPEEAKEIRAVNRAANIAKHGRGRGGRHHNGDEVGLCKTTESIKGLAASTNVQKDFEKKDEQERAQLCITEPPVDRNG